MKKLNRRNLLKRSIELFVFSGMLQSIKISGAQSSNHTRNANMIIIWKSKRKMSLFYNRELIKTYNIRLGFNPIGHKQKEGDGKTPEGRYFITHHNPNSAYHKSLGISYPNAKDKADARKRKEPPGNNIFIHGGPQNIITHFFKDWTGGCIAVLDKEIEEIYQLVPDGTVIYIYS
ncbi:MAG: L,D-transpeptidase family protein [Paracoccaceae bacterium]|nr:L,D-transpeptidase family protein [Paracoccaceae bacterium]